MIKVSAEALVTYTCILKNEDEKKVRAYAEENGVSISTAITTLWEECEIDIYAGYQTESDCSTESVSLLEDED